MIGSNGAGIDPHTDQAHLGLAGMLVLQQLVQKRAGSKNIKYAGLQRHNDVAGHLHHFVQALAVQAGGRVQHHMGCAFGRFGDMVDVRFPSGNWPRRRWA